MQWTTKRNNNVMEQDIYDEAATFINKTLDTLTTLAQKDPMLCEMLEVPEVASLLAQLRLWWLVDWEGRNVWLELQEVLVLRANNYNMKRRCLIYLLDNLPIVIDDPQNMRDETLLEDINSYLAGIQGNK